MRGLVEPECGGVNPLVRLTNRYTADRARVVEGVGLGSREVVGQGKVSSQGLVTEFLAETRDVAARPVHTFRMDSLLSEMREIEGRQIQPRSEYQSVIGFDEVNELTVIRLQTMISVQFESKRSQKGVNFRPGPGVAALARTGKICFSSFSYNCLKCCTCSTNFLLFFRNHPH